MRTAVISDIHGNLEAAEAVLADAATVGCHRIVCLGDLVGYGPDPAACIDLVLERSEATVMGNHDAASAEVIGTGEFNPWADAAIRWTRGVLDRERLGRLAALPLTASAGGALLVHASPLRPASWDYLFDLADVAEAMASSHARLVFVGHTHVAAGFALPGDGVVRRVAPSLLRLEPGTRYLVNSGSVGQPRDRLPSACWCLWDEDAGTVSWRRVSYPFGETQRKMRDAGLPERLVTRLAEGR